MSTLTFHLPGEGKIFVKEGQKVQAGDILGEGQVRTPKTINLAKILRLAPQKVIKCLLKKLGQEVAQGEIIAQKKGFLGLGRRKFKTPVSGTLESLENETGILTISCPERTLSLVSPLAGRVKEIKNNEVALSAKEIIIEFSGLKIEAKEGAGPKTSGQIFADFAQKEKIDLWDLNRDFAGKIVLGKDWPSETLSKAQGLGVAAILACKIAKDDLVRLTKGKMVSFAGCQQEIRLTLLILKEEDFEKVKRFAGFEAIVDGEEREIIIPQGK